MAATLIVLASQAADTADPNSNTNSFALTKSDNSSESYRDYAGKFGVGATFGEPIGADVMKSWFNAKTAINGAIGYSLHDDAELNLHRDIWWYAFHLFPLSPGQLPLYFGVGSSAGFKTDDNPNQVGIRTPAGISYMFENAPVDIFMEVGPTLDIAPGLRGEVTGGMGVRFWF